ncbi:MAG: phosphatidate cytidylyltransferase [Deltaproteobacteria bacterium]|nr:phosphatidate cytidylyltransferase [Deltaproteobacteria bacterium]
MTPHLKRLATALILIPLVLIIIVFAPPWIFSLLVMSVALICLNEYYSFIMPRASKQIIALIYFLTATLFYAVLHKGFSYVAIIPFFFIFIFVSFLFDSKRNTGTIGDIGQILLGPMYINLPLLLLVIIFMFKDGKFWILFLLTVAFAGDTASFYFGKLFGRHKLSDISPGKTIEGAIAGLIAAIVFGCFFSKLFFPSLSILSIMLLAFAMAISCQLGDLAESMLKRISKVKDSGTILPGHGGMLDRVDSLLFAIPFLYLYLSI